MTSAKAGVFKLKIFTFFVSFYHIPTTAKEVVQNSAWFRAM